jgi:hypothetical protein
MESKIENISIETLDAPVRAQLLKELPINQRRKTVTNLVECAMRMGLTDAYDIRLWLGLPSFNIATIKAARDATKKRWLENVGEIAETAATERVIQIRRSWENVRKCEQMFNEAKSIGDKVKVKQLELQYLQYIAKLNFIDQMIEDEGPSTQINVVAGSINNDS